ncbi:TetR/AcrR family transcriptional regulator [Saccharopolyspora griseoalba]|uniref:TetR/AcrR family transcriptional regulator n=1 Tax=Saccharopolyspora griseoalba TaxID=1431848 RepID=A0ABW2LS10_9PSEU
MGSAAADRGRVVRQKLLGAAVELIPERGWAGVSTRVLAERAGVNPSVVHYHFSSLRELMNEAVAGLMRRGMAEFESAFDETAPPAEAVRTMFASVEGYTGDDPTSLVFVEAYLAATRDEELRERIRGEIEGFSHRLSALLARNGVPAPEVTAAVLGGALDGLLLHRGLGAGQDTEQIVEVLRRLVDRAGAPARGALPDNP